jgi:hypothetical protein
MVNPMKASVRTRLLWWEYLDTAFCKESIDIDFHSLLDVIAEPDGDTTSLSDKASRDMPAALIVCGPAG